MEVRKQNKVLTLLFFFAGIAMFYFNNTYLSLGDRSVSIKYLIGAVLVFLAVIYGLVEADANTIKEILKDGAVLILPYLVLLFFSMILWVYHVSPVSVITRGGFSVVYQCIGLCVAVSYVVVFRTKAPFVQLASMVAAELILIFVECIRSLGMGGFLKAYADLILSIGEVKADGFTAIEMNELCFAFGIYLLFFLLAKQKIRYRFWLILLTAFLTSVGLKRIVIAGVFCSFIMSFFCGLFSEKIAKKILNILKYVLIIAGIAYIVFVKTGLYNDVAQWLGIDTKGRVELNNFIDQYYTISPVFFGYGLGYIVRLLQTGAFRAATDIEALHNDILRLYIEIGFWGFLAWIFTFWGYRISYFSRRSIQTCLVAFSAFLYCFITYLTDNTSFYFYTNMAVFTVTLACVCRDVEGELKENE